MKNVFSVMSAYWATLAQRERRAIRLAAGVLLVALVWGVMLAPAWRTVRASSANMAQLDQALEHMQRLQARARALQSQAVVPAAELRRQLQGSVALLGSGASLQLQGERAVLTLTQVASTDLAAWLASDRGQGVRPVEAHLKRDNAANPAWTGTMVFQLPAAN